MERIIEARKRARGGFLGPLRTGQEADVEPENRWGPLGVAAAKGGSGGAAGPAGGAGALVTISNYVTWPSYARPNTPHGGNRAISRG